jgi:hypothetical protein
MSQSSYHACLRSRLSTSVFIPDVMPAEMRFVHCEAYVVVIRPCHVCECRGPCISVHAMPVIWSLFLLMMLAGVCLVSFCKRYCSNVGVYHGGLTGGCVLGGCSLTNRIPRYVNKLCPLGKTMTSTLSSLNTKSSGVGECAICGTHTQQLPNTFGRGPRGGQV